EVQRPVALGGRQDDPAPRADDVEGLEHRFRVVGCDVDYHVGTLAGRVRHHPGQVRVAFDVDRDVGAELFGQVEAITVVGQAGDAQPGRSGGLGGEDARQAARSRAHDLYLPARPPYGVVVRQRGTL